MPLSRLRAFARKMIGRSIDSALGVETDQDIRYDELEFGVERGVSYYATSWLRILPLCRILRTLKIEPGDVFLDVGCGKDASCSSLAAFHFAD